MTTPTASELLRSFTDGIPSRPLAPRLLAARADLRAAVETLRSIPDDRLAEPWPWKGGSEEEVRYAFYRIAESFERAAIDAADLLRAGAPDRGRAGDLVAPATAARWDLDGLLLPLAAATWDADPGGGEWRIRRTLGHVIGSQRAYGVGSGWWLRRSFAADDPTLPASVPEELWASMPDEEVEGAGSPEEVRRRLSDLLDETTERLAGLSPAHLALGARWSGFAVDVGFRLGRWGSHMREHTIQVEKTLALLGHRPTEVDRLVRHVAATWGRSEAAVYGRAGADAAIEPLASAARAARDTAAEVVRHIGTRG